jgi:CheY-like chemotaxis protein
MRILVVDNQPRARKSMTALLSAWYQCAEIHEAVDGYEAVELAEKFQPDIILMDARMPRMSGLEAILLIRAKSRNVKIIALSMYPDIQSKALEAGADAFVSKSDSPEKLRETLKRIYSANEQEY